MGAAPPAAPPLTQQGDVAGQPAPGHVTVEVTVSKSNKIQITYDRGSQYKTKLQIDT